MFCVLQAWKDMRLRFRKAGIDIRHIVRSLRSQKVIDTKALLENVDKLESAKGVNRVRVLEECGINVSKLDDETDDIAKYPVTKYYLLRTQ